MKFYVDAVRTVGEGAAFNIALDASHMQAAMQRINDISYGFAFMNASLNIDRISTKPSRGIKYLEL